MTAHDTVIMQPSLLVVSLRSKVSQSHIWTRKHIQFDEMIFLLSLIWFNISKRKDGKRASVRHRTFQWGHKGVKESACVALSTIDCAAEVSFGFEAAKVVRGCEPCF